MLNLGLEATNKLQIGNDYVDFQARFGGVARELSIPVGRVTAIYARENGAGMAFEIEDESGEGAEVTEAPTDVAAVEPPDGPDRPDGGRPKLQRIK